MAYQVLARKYRPQSFSDVAGQDHVTRTLMNALSQGRIAHGYIFSGHRGIGKTTIARILAMALNCRTAIGAAGPDGTPARHTPEPCGVCDSCTEIRAGNAVDVIEIDAATNRGIDEIRELRDAARYRPARDRYKIYILDEAHQITDAAFNALLKTLEEPPDHVVFMMATTQPEDIPQTIRSRCQHFSFHAVKFDDILAQLRSIADQEQVGADDEALALLAEAGDGSMRDALSIMDQAIASAPLVHDQNALDSGGSKASDGSAGHVRLDAAQIRELMGSVPNTVFERILEAIGENQSAPVLDEINRLLNAGNSASQLARQFVRYLRNVLMARIAGESTELLQLSPDERARSARSALLFSEEDLTRFLQVMLRTFDELNYRQEPRFHLELGLLKLVHLQRLLPVEQLLSQIGSSAPAPRLGGGPLPGRTASSDPATRPGAGPRTAGSAIAPQPGSASSTRLGAPSLGSTPRPSAEPNRTSPGGQPLGTPLSPQASRPSSQPSRPTFSPFEEDSRRKSSEMSSRPATATASAPAPAIGILEIDEAQNEIQNETQNETRNEIPTVAESVAEAVRAAAPSTPPVSPVEDWSAETSATNISESVATVPATPPVPAAAASTLTFTPTLSASAEIRSAPEGVLSSPSAVSVSAQQVAGLTAANPHPTAPPIQADAAAVVTADVLGAPAKTAASFASPFTAEAGEEVQHPSAIPAAGTPSLTAPAIATKPRSADLDATRERVVAALEQAGHNTAAALMQNGTWHDQGETIRVEVAAKKTMLGLTMNAEAERICREVMRQHAGNGQPRTLTFVPGEGTTRGSAAPRAAMKLPTTGSIQAQALENPLVKQAQELFRAEIRSVVDLRQK